MSPYFKVFLAAFGGVALALALLLGYAISQAHDRPPPGTHATPAPHPFWLTPDNDGGRAAHRGFSALIGLGLRLHDREAPWWDRTGWCMLPGVGKELLDYRRGSGVSRKDLGNNLLGCLAGVGLGGGLIYLARQDGRPMVMWRLVRD